MTEKAPPGKFSRAMAMDGYIPKPSKASASQSSAPPKGGSAVKPPTKKS